MLKKLLALLLAMLMVVYSMAFAANEDITTDGVGEGEEDLDAILNEAIEEDVSEEEVGSGTETTGNDTTTSGWGYKDSDLITATATSDTVILKSPVLKDNAGNNIMSYKVKYSSKSFAEPIDTASGISDVKEYVANYQLSGTILVPTEGATTYSGTETEINITITGLTPGSTYYAIIYPQNNESFEGTPSKEVMFQTAIAHEAAATTGSNSLNLRYEMDGTKITVFWTPVEGAKTVQIQYKTNKDQDYKKLADIPVSDGKFTFDGSAGTGDSFVQALALNAVGEQIGSSESIDIKPNGETPIKAPKVGPESTLLIGLMILAVLVYITYRVRKIEKA